MSMANIDTSELEYLKSCRDKLRDVSDVVDEKDKKDRELSAEEKLREIKKIIKGDNRRNHESA